MKHLICIITLLIVCFSARADEKVFYFISHTQVEAQADFFKKKTATEADKKLLKTERDMVLITLDLNAFRLSVNYLNNSKKNKEWQLNAKPSGTSTAFSFQILNDNEFTFMDYESESGITILTLEDINGNRMIFGELKETKIDDFLVLYLKKTDWVLTSSSRASLPSGQQVPSIDTSKFKVKLIRANSIISIDKLNKALLFKDKSGQFGNIDVRYGKTSYEESAGIKALLFTKLSDDNIEKIILSLTTDTFLIIYKNKSSIAFTNLEVL